MFRDFLVGTTVPAIFWTGKYFRFTQKFIHIKTPISKCRAYKMLTGFHQKSCFFLYFAIESLIK